MTQYADILSTPRNEIKEPQPTPVGTYTAVVKQMPTVDKKGKNNTDAADFVFVLTNPGPDVDPAQLDAAGGLPKEIRHTFWLTPQSNFIIERFFQAAGITDSDAPTIADALTQSVGRSVTVTVDLGKPSAKTGKQFPEITQFAAA